MRANKNIPAQSSQAKVKIAAAAAAPVKDGSVCFSVKNLLNVLHHRQKGGIYLQLHTNMQVLNATKTFYKSGLQCEGSLFLRVARTNQFLLTKSMWGKNVDVRERNPAVR